MDFDSSSGAGEQWLALALRAASMVAWSVTLPDRRIRFSDGAAEFYGRPLAELGAGWRFVHPDDAPRLRRAADEAIRTGGDYVEVIRYQVPGAPLRWLEVRGNVHRNAAGVPVALHGITWDITARRVAEQAARVNRALIEHLPGGSAFVVDRDGRYVAVGGEALAHAGLVPEQFVGRRVGDVLEPAVAGKFVGLFRRALAGEPFAVEAEADGRAYQGHGVPLRDAQGEVDGALAVFYDVTERKRIEVALRRSETEFRGFFELSAAGSALADPRTGRFLRVNRRFCEITGYSEEELLSMSPLDLTHPDDRSEAPDAQGSAMRGQSDRFEVEKRYVRRDGRTVWVHVAGRLLVDDDGQPYHAVASVVDVTARKQAEEELRAADRRKDEFLAMLAHELRNPLAPIRYSARLLRADAPGTTLATARATIERQAAHMARLLDDLLDVSRITRNVIELRRETLDLRRTIEEVVGGARPLAEAAQHRLAVSLPGEGVWVTGDPTRLAQIVDNLLQNAVKYTDAGGRIGVDLATERGEAVIRVTDSGIGIPADRLEDVFALFAQVHRHEPARRAGLGIGLAVVKRLVELHGGRLTAASDGPGRGSTFTVRLPLAPAPHAAVSTAASGTPYGVRPRVLLVDDHEDIVASLAALLRLEGYPVHTAADGPAALRLADAVRPDVVVLDLGLPGMSGHDVARALRAAPWGAGLRLIAATGWGQAEDRRRSQEAGFDTHLTKPVDPDELLRLIAVVPRSAPGAHPAG